jgi:hypothetical protein
MRMAGEQGQPSPGATTPVNGSREARFSVGPLDNGETVL